MADAAAKATQAAASEGLMFLPNAAAHKGGTVANASDDALPRHMSQFGESGHF